MPTVSANVIPGTGSEPSQVSDAQTGSGGKDPMPTVQPGVALWSETAADLGGMLLVLCILQMTMVKRTLALRQRHLYRKIAA